MQTPQNDTISAIITPPGPGGIAVIRISGPGAISIADGVFQGATPLASAPAQTVHFGRVIGADGNDLDEALATPGPVVVEAVVDPNEPPMPAKIKPRQALHLAQALAKGQPNREKIAATILEDKVRELI